MPLIRKALHFLICAGLLVLGAAHLHAQDDASVALGPKLGLLATANAHSITLDHSRALYQGLDQLAQPSVKSMTTTTPPGSPSGGDAYILQPGSTPTGAWAGHAGTVVFWNALYQSSGTNVYAPQWVYLTPQAGWREWVVDAGEAFLYNGTAWVSEASAGGAVTSVALSLPADFTVSGSPVTSTGTLTGAWATTPTGSGAMVRATSPALVTPSLGVASTTSLNINGTAGAGFFELAGQSGTPATPPTHTMLFYGAGLGAAFTVMDSTGATHLVATVNQNNSWSATQDFSTATLTLPTSAFANPSATVGLAAVNGSATTIMRSDAAPALSQAIAPTWTGLHTWSQPGIGATSTDAAVLSNGTAAGVGAQQWSPRLRLTGQGWKTNSTAASQTVDWILENQPVQGAANPTSQLVFSSQVNAGGYTGDVYLFSSGALGLGSSTDPGASGVLNVSTGFRIGNAATSGHYLRGNGTSYVDAAIASGDLPGSFSGFANPTASAGLSAINGTATTAMRSDGAPAIDQTIAPTWTGTHAFGNGTGAATILEQGAAGNARDIQFRTGSTSAGLRWIFRVNGTSESGSNAGSDFNVIGRDDSGNNLGTWLAITRSSGSATFAGTTDASSTSVAGLVTSGGLGVAKQAYFGDQVHTVASTTTRAGLTLPAGTAPTSPNVGDLWQDSTQKAPVSYASGGVAEALVGTIFTATADGSVTNTTSETSLLGTGVGTKTLPANALVAGKTVRVVVKGYVGDTLTPTLTLKFKMGSTVLVNTGAVTLPALTGNNLLSATFLVTCRTTGTSGTVYAQGDGKVDNGTTIFTLASPNTATTTINTTVTQTLDVTATWSAASSSNTAVGNLATIEILN